jgi:hypothetical protein
MPAPAKEVKATDKDGKEVSIPNPEYARWISLDQCVLRFLVWNMSREIITQMVGQTSSGGVWKVVMEMFSSQSKAHVVLKGICPRGNNKVVITIFHVYDKYLFLMLELY